MKKDELYSLSKDIDKVNAGSKLLKRFNGVSKMTKEDITKAITELDNRDDGDKILDYVDENLLDAAKPTRMVKREIKSEFGLSNNAANYLVDMSLRNLSDEVSLAGEFARSLYFYDRNIGILSEAIDSTISGETPDFDLQTLYIELRHWTVAKSTFLNSAVSLQVAQQNALAAEDAKLAAEKNGETLEELQRKLEELG